MMWKKLYWFIAGLCSTGAAIHASPDLAEVRTAAELMLKSDCTQESMRNTAAQRTIQQALDVVSPQVYMEFYRRGLAYTQAELESIYRKYPVLYYYDRSFEKVLQEVRNGTVPAGETHVWLIYNMGAVVKTAKHCFGIDIHHRRAEELVPYLEFTLVTHHHNDHYTEKFLTAMNRAKKVIYSGFYPSYGGYSKEPFREITHGELTIRMYESDHNRFLRKFVTPFEIVCGKDANSCVIFTSGDTCDARQLHPRSAVDLHLVHPRVGLDVRESARDTVKPRITLIAHLQELHHGVNMWRWSYQDGYTEAEKVRSVGKTAWVPMWGEKIILKGKNHAEQDL